MTSAWRIAAPDYATTPDEMMSGEGASRVGGRWNSKGTRLAYLGSSRAQAAMELLVHLDSAQALKAFSLLQVDFDESLIVAVDPADLPSDWHSPKMASAVRSIGDEWVKNEDSAILAVPSAVIKGETNYLYNPAHPDADKVEFGDIEEFSFDPRVVRAKSP